MQQQQQEEQWVTFHTLYNSLGSGLCTVLSVFMIVYDCVLGRDDAAAQRKTTGGTVASSGAIILLATEEEGAMVSMQ